MTRIEFARELKMLLEGYGLFKVERDNNANDLVLKVSLDGVTLFEVTIRCAR